MLKSMVPRAGSRRNVGLALVAGCVVLALAVSPARAASAVIERVSIASGDAQGYLGGYQPAVSADGRFVAFLSRPVGSWYEAVFVRDRLSGRTERVSVTPDGSPSQAYSGRPALSADGRLVAFDSLDDGNLVAGDTNNAYDVFVRDRQIGVSERVSVGSNGAQGDQASTDAAISADGRFVAFRSDAWTLVDGDEVDTQDVFVHDRQTGVTERVGVGGEGPAISADGRFVAFTSGAPELGAWGMFVHDRQTGVIERVGAGRGPALSADGRFVAFTSGHDGVVVHDRRSGRTEPVSVDPDGAAANSPSYSPAISADGRFVAFISGASNLVAGDTNGVSDVFVRDRKTASTERISVAADGAQSNGHSRDFVAISADGRSVAFDSAASNLVAGDTNNAVDVFVRDRDADCTIFGTPGDDMLAGTPGNDVICGLGGDDTLTAGGGHDVVRGGGGDDRLSGGSGRDRLDGGDGDDHLGGGSGADALAGGPGVDRASYWARSAPVTLTIGDGPNDGASDERDDVHADVEQLAGGQGDDTLTGDHADNRLSGNGGNDRLTGREGRDQLVGGDGDDSLDGRDAGPDRLSCGAGLDTALRDPIDWLSAACENR